MVIDKIFVYCDRSGSMSHDALRHARFQLEQLAFAMAPSASWMEFGFDTEVFPIAENKLKGMGGTDLQPVEKHIEENADYFTLVAIISDCYAPPMTLPKNCAMLVVIPVRL